MSVVSKAGFKETDAGWIPSKWDVARLGDLANVDSESLSNKTLADFEFSYISLGDVSEGSLIDSVQKILFSDAPSRARRIVRVRDILFSTVRPNLKGHYFAKSVQGDVIASTGFAVVRAKEGITCPEYLYHYLLSVKADEQIEKLTVGSNYPAVNSSDVKRLWVIRPSLPEQQKIAAILTTVDDKLDVISRQISTAQKLKQGLMQSLFSIGLGTQDEAWPTVPLFDVAEIRTGVAKGKKGLKNPIELPYLRVANVQDGHIDLKEIKTIGVEKSNIERYSLQPGDVLMTEGGDFDKLGRGDVWEAQISPCLHQNHVFAVRPNPAALNSYYLAALAASDYGRKYFLSCSKRTTNLASINSTQLKAFPVLLPPLAEQRRIAEVVEAANMKISSLRAKQTSCRTLKRGLMQKLLTGEWRVEPDDALLAA